MNDETFYNDDKTVDAVMRNFEIIGEEANRLHPDFKLLNSSIDWNKLRGFRNRIVNEYFGIDLEIVWSIITNDLQNLKVEIENIPLS